MQWRGSNRPREAFSSWVQASVDREGPERLVAVKPAHLPHPVDEAVRIGLGQIGEIEELRHLR